MSFSNAWSSLSKKLSAIIIYLNYKAKKDNTGDNKRFIQVITLEIILNETLIKIISKIEHNAIT